MYYNNQSFTTSVKRGYNRMPIAIRTIITLTVVIFLIQEIAGWVGGKATSEFIIGWFAFDPNLGVALSEPWRFVTYMFLHGGFWHILFNMLWLWWMGRAVEERMGPLAFCSIYFISGIGGALLDILIAKFLGIRLVIGASGAVFGVMVAFAMLYPRMPIMLFLLPPIEARYVVAGLIALQVLFLGGNGHVARVVHIGGALVGFLLMSLYKTGYNLGRPGYIMQGWWYRIKQAFNRRKTSSKSNNNMYSVSDVEVINETDQTQLDDILDKISNEGYDALTKEEKKRLFEMSKEK
jgi:membrane associated rhomboid family serine protease